MRKSLNPLVPGARGPTMIERQVLLRVYRGAWPWGAHDSTKHRRACSGALSRLQKLGLVEYTADGASSRASFYRCTPRGEAVASEAVEGS